MSKTVLQVPIDRALRKEAEKAAFSAGFSSVQEVVRVFLKKFADEAVDISFREKSVPLSKAAEKRYMKMVKDIENDKDIVDASDTGELFSTLE